MGHGRATAERAIPVTLRVIFLLAGMRDPAWPAILTVMALRCLIVDDNVGFLRSARLLLEREGMSVVAVASSGDEAVLQAEELQPDVVLVDVDLGPESGFDVVGRLHGRCTTSTPHLILISIHTAEDLADLVAASPAAGFISKSHLSTRAIRDLLDGRDGGRRPEP